jgi:glucose-1-phosphate adenylyltransferase
MPFAGSFRIIDAVLSNLMHSKLENVWIVERFRPFTLNGHLAGGRPWDLDSTRHGFHLLPPAEGRAEEGFSTGNGHALHQQVPPLQAYGAGTVVVLSADHLYHLDLRSVLAQHAARGSELTVVTTEISEDPSRYGVVQVDDDGGVTRYDYKPQSPEGQLVATEIFVYSVGALAEVTEELVARERAAEETAAASGEEPAHNPAVDGDSLGDDGESIIPALVAPGAALDAVIADVGAPIPEGPAGESKPSPGNITVLVPAERGPASQADETTGP